MSRPHDTPMYEYIHDTIHGICPRSAAIEYEANSTLPDSFAVFYLVSSNPEGHFSDASMRENARYSVAYHDRDKRNIETVGAQVITAMKNAGFLYVSTSPDIYHSDSGHWARTIDFRYYEEV